MLISRHKKKTNIVEYLIYMFQIEDMIRACKFDIKEIESKIIFPTNFEAIILVEMREWYEDLIEQMKSDDVEEIGHIQSLNDIIEELIDLHLILINAVQDKEYINLFNNALPSINELKSKTDKFDISEVEICLNGLYGILLLRLQKKEISEGTMMAMLEISKMMAYLAKKYKEKQSGKLELPNELKN